AWSRDEVLRPLDNRPRRSTRRDRAAVRLQPQWAAALRLRVPVLVDEIELVESRIARGASEYVFRFLQPPDVISQHVLIETDNVANGVTTVRTQCTGRKLQTISCPFPVGVVMNHLSVCQSLLSGVASEVTREFGTLQDHLARRAWRTLSHKKSLASGRTVEHSIVPGNLPFFNGCSASLASDNETTVVELAIVRVWWRHFHVQNRLKSNGRIVVFFSRLHLPSHILRCGTTRGSVHCSNHLIHAGFLGRFPDGSGTGKRRGHSEWNDLRPQRSTWQRVWSAGICSLVSLVEIRSQRRPTIWIQRRCGTTQSIVRPLPCPLHSSSEQSAWVRVYGSAGHSANGNTSRGGTVIRQIAFVLDVFRFLKIDLLFSIFVGIAYARPLRTRRHRDEIGCEFSLRLF
ncbi:hypothetical protein PFISCL1PPCAC_27947, partial [Pristionchus fissidentatus]